METTGLWGKTLKATPISCMAGSIPIATISQSGRDPKIWKHKKGREINHWKGLKKCYIWLNCVIWSDPISIKYCHNSRSYHYNSS